MADERDAVPDNEPTEPGCAGCEALQAMINDCRELVRDYEVPVKSNPVSAALGLHDELRDIVGYPKGYIVCPTCRGRKKVFVGGLFTAQPSVRPCPDCTPTEPTDERRRALTEAHRLAVEARALDEAVLVAHPDNRWTELLDAATALAEFCRSGEFYADYDESTAAIGRVDKAVAALRDQP